MYYNLVVLVFLKLMLTKTLVVCRIESKGKGFLQPHQLIAEFEAIPEANRLKLMDGAFVEVLKSTQVLFFCLVNI